jgi:hypothetical protein
MKRFDIKEEFHLALIMGKKLHPFQSISTNDFSKQSTFELSCQTQNSPIYPNYCMNGLHIKAF